MSAVVQSERTLHPLALELNFSAPAVEEVKKGDKTELWTDILRAGEIATTPGQAKKVPFTVVASGPSSSTKRVISFEDIIKGYDAKAFGDVTIPDGHPKPDRIDPRTQKIIKGDSALNNTGYVRGLRVVEKDVNLGDTILKDCPVLQADMGFTEPEAAARAKRGSIPNVSSGIFFDFVRKADDRYFPCALNHVALTKNPWITGLEGFPKVFFGDDTLEQDGIEFEVLNFDGDTATDEGDAKVIWSDKLAANYIRRALEQHLNPREDSDDPTKPYVPRAYYYVEDVTHTDPNVARVEESYKGKTTSFVVPYTVNDDGSVVAAPSTRWIEGKTAMIAASDEDAHGDPMTRASRSTPTGSSGSDWAWRSANFSVKVLPRIMSSRKRPRTAACCFATRRTAGSTSLSSTTATARCSSRTCQAGRRSRLPAPPRRRMHQGRRPSPSNRRSTCQRRKAGLRPDDTQ
jgi:hypothetical protein